MKIIAGTAGSESHGGSGRLFGLSLGRVVPVLVMAGFVLALTGCHGLPPGTTKNVTVGSSKLEANGAGIVKADAQKITFRIRCTVCGFETGDMTIDTPAPGKPYVLDWVCPKCGHRQKVTISVTGP